MTNNDPCKCSVEINGTVRQQPCTEWQYDDSVFESTLVTQVMDSVEFIPGYINIYVYFLFYDDAGMFVHGRK